MAISNIEPPPPPLIQNIAVEPDLTLVDFGETLKLRITERLVFSYGATTLSSVQLRAIDSVAIAIGKSVSDDGGGGGGGGDDDVRSKPIIEVVHQGGDGDVDQGRVDLVEQALENAGIMRGRIRSRIEEKKKAKKTSAGGDAGSCTFRVIQEIRFDGSINFVPCGSGLVLEPETESLLSQMASLLKRNKFHKVIIEGHSDSAPHPFGTNLSLSLERSSSVKSYLLELGVPESSVTSTGYGSSLPLSSNSTRLGRSLNRRVVFLISEHSTISNLHSLKSSTVYDDKSSTIQELLNVVNDHSNLKTIRDAAAEVALALGYKWNVIRIIYIALHKNIKNKNCPMNILNEDCVREISKWLIILS
ncbi:hypothetical protein TrVE_jg2333 [Triparma verrucosa]|uniref:OmpA-like domain-containing protein n=1 Tax=Triparma verrucosa TaxID=1606542 RepID=A0A9W7FEL9_9STRA|nr:hypothetical protein TrVE_jg2333 [Triparma verrucosa]